MASRRLRSLLYLLAATAAASAAAAATVLALERLSSARSEVATLEKEMGRLAESLSDASGLERRRDELQVRRHEIEGRYYNAEDMSPYAFGDLIKGELARLGVEVERYQLIDSGGRSLLQFTVGGSALALMSFLKSVSESARYVSVPSLTLRTHGDGGRVDLVFQVGYELLGEDDR